MTENTTAQPGQPNILTIVLEDYFQVAAFKHLIPNDNWDRFETRLKHNTHAALDLLETTNNRATFFTSGWTADHHPDVLTEIVKAGHEVACQGYFHHSIQEVSRQLFVKDLVRSRNAVENAIGSCVLGFRISSGWIGEKDLWALDALAEQGFAYDSSLCRIGKEFSNEPFRAVAHKHQSPTGELYEVPVSSMPFLGWSVPISGGNYWRQFPRWPLQWGIKRWLATHNEPLVLYFHTWELDATQPRISAANAIQRMRHYRNLASMPEKIKHYLETYRFTSIAEHLSLDTKTERLQADRVDAITPESSSAVDTQKSAVPLTLIIPCFNEEASLAYLKKTLDRFSSKSHSIFDLRYIIVDDGSRDKTWQLLQQLFGDQERCMLIKHDNNKGIAAALITAFGRVKTELLAVIDADCTFDPDQLMEMIALLTEDVDVVAASPAHKQGAMRNVSFFRSLLSRGSAFMYRCVLHHKLTSYTSCFRLYRRRTIKDMRVSNPGFCGVAEILGRIDLGNFRIVEYPAVLEVRLLGESKINIFRTIVDHLKLILQLAGQRWLGRPMPEQYQVKPESKHG